MMSWIFALLGLAAAVAGGGAIATGWPLLALERESLVIAGSALAAGGLVCLAIAALMAETRRARRAIERALEELAWSRPVERMSSRTLPPEDEIGAPRPAEQASASSVASPAFFDKIEPAIPTLPVMPAAAPLGVPEPLTHAKPAEPEPARQEPKLEPPPSPAASAPSSSAHSPATPPRSAAASEAHQPEKEAEELQPARSFSVGDTSFVVFTDGTIEARTPKGARRFNSMEEVRSYLEESAAS